MCDCEPGEVGYCSDCELLEVNAELRRLRSRCRAAAQTLIEAVGAPGPLNVEQAAERAVARIAELEAEAAASGERIELVAKSAAASFDLLRGVVDAIRGPHPDPLTRWSVHDAPELAAALLAERDTILLASAKWSTALRELAEDIDDTKRNAGELTVAVAFHRTNCPECDEDPEESIGLCPYHKAKALLAGD